MDKKKKKLLAGIEQLQLKCIPRVENNVNS